MLAVRRVLTICRTLVKPWFIDPGQASARCIPPVGLTTKIECIAEALFLFGRTTLQVLEMSPLGLVTTGKPRLALLMLLTLLVYVPRELSGLIETVTAPMLCVLNLFRSVVACLSLAA